MTHEANYPQEFIARTEAVCADLDALAKQADGEERTLAQEQAMEMRRSLYASLCPDQDPVLQEFDERTTIIMDEEHHGTTPNLTEAVWRLRESVTLMRVRNAHESLSLPREDVVMEVCLRMREALRELMQDHVHTPTHDIKTQFNALIALIENLFSRNVSEQQKFRGAIAEVERQLEHIFARCKT